MNQPDRRNPLVDLLVSIVLIFGAAMFWTSCTAKADDPPETRTAMTVDDAEPGDWVIVQWAKSAPDSEEVVTRFIAWAGTRAVFEDPKTKKPVSVQPPWFIDRVEARRLDVALEFYDASGLYLGTRTDRIQAIDANDAMRVVKAALVANAQPGGDGLTPANSTTPIPAAVSEVRAVVSNLRGVELGRQMVKREK